MSADAAAQHATALNQATLPELAIPVPAYDRDALRVGIVHIGVGGFHRAHQAMYLDRLFAAGRDQDWALCGVGVLDADHAMGQVLHRQDELYTLVEKHPDDLVSHVNELQHVYGNLLADIIERGRENGVLRPDVSPALDAGLIMTSLHGLLVQGFMGRESERSALLLQHVKATLVDTLRRR